MQHLKIFLRDYRNEETEAVGTLHIHVSETQLMFCFKRQYSQRYLFTESGPPKIMLF
jgi:hypothetical protein